jgi:hypothetical protein
LLHQRGAARANLVRGPDAVRRPSRDLSVRGCSLLKPQKEQFH